MQAFERLEEEFGKWAGVHNVVACSSGTSALHLALEALQLPLGSEVLVPEFTMIACARAVTMAGLKPVFVDCGDDLLMDVDKLDDNLTGNTVAVMPVHVYGRRCDMDVVATLAADNGLMVVEDLAEAHGVPVHPNTDAACWSFYRNKIVAGEEGGAVAFKIKANADYARELRSVGFTEDHNFLHSPRGFNARLSNANAELILENLKYVEGGLTSRQWVKSRYDELVPEEWRMPQRDVVWVYDVRIPEVDLDAVIRYCNGHEVAARHGFKPMSMQPEYRKRAVDYQQLNAYQLSQEILYLPVDPTMMKNRIEYNVEILRAGVAASPATASP